MGIFSEKVSASVASVSYNMGGPEEDRPEFLKAVVLGNMLSRGNATMGETIVNNYLNGPVMKLRSFYRWAETNYASVGIPRDAFYSTRELSQTAVLNAITDLLGSTVKIDWVEMALADPTYWGMKWMAQNMPNERGEWRANYNTGAEYGTITFADGITPTATFPVEGYVYGERYIYASYVEASGNSTGPLVTGEIDVLDPLDPFPSTAEWLFSASSTTPLSKQLITTTITTKTYSDGRSPVVTTNELIAQASYERYIGVYTRTVYNGVVDGIRTSTKEYMTLSQDRVLGSNVTNTSSSEVIEGVTVTTAVQVTEETLTLQKTVRVDTQTVTLSMWSSPKIFIYRSGSGNAALDELFVGYEKGDGYFPLIPIRLKNNFVSESYEPTLYEESKKAYKKAFNSDFDELITKINENPDIDDIDYAYVVFGANLNTKNVAARQYIYEYFHRLMLQAPGSLNTDMQNWVTNVYEPFEATTDTYVEWSELQGDIGEGSPTTEYVPEPEYPTFQAPPITELRVKTDNSVLNFDMQIDWDSIREIKGTGLGKPEAKAGDIWFTGVANDPYTHAPPRGIEPTPSEVTLYKNQVLTMWWQLTDTTWKKLEITGLVNRNYIWNNKAVITWGIEALLDEEESSFIVPLHEDVFRKLPIKVATEMSSSAAHILFNVYVITKQHWYQRGIFKVLMFVAAVVITVINPPAGLAAFATALGVNVIIAAAILVAINMVVAMILMRIIVGVSVAIFGEKVGQIVANVAYLVMAMFTLDFSNTGSAIISWSKLLDPVNLIAMTNAVGNGIIGLLNTEAQEYVQKTQDMMERYDSQMEDLAQKYKDVLGDGISYIDPMGLTETSYGWYETRETFLSRTLLTGSDIAELSHKLLNNFPEITLRLDKPI